MIIYMINNQDLTTTSEAAKYLGIKKSTLYTLLSMGYLPYLEIEGIKFIDAQAVIDRRLRLNKEREQGKAE